jgi:hypothetical protein
MSGFKPAHDPALAERLKNISWFSHCGKQNESSAPFAVEWCPSWEAAQTSCASPEWENLTLDARNGLTAFLHEHANREYQHWNEIAKRARDDVIKPLETGAWVPYINANHLDIKVLHCLQWDVLAALMESAYRQVRKKVPDFFSRLIVVYESGHFPCGWSGDWPEGKLCVW